MDTSKIIKGAVSSGRYTVTAPIVKEDYGLYLQIEGVELPSTYEVDFSNSESSGTSVTMIGNADGVLIPRQFIDSGKDVFAFLYHVGENFGRTVYKFRIPNKARPDRTNEEPTPEEQSTIDQAISALNSAVEQTAQDKADADASAQNASADAERAEDAKTDAQNFATQAEQSAADAQESASQASASATASAQSASQSAQIKADVEDLADDAQGYAQSAEQSAQNAHTYALSANAASDTAENFADVASGYASQAQSSAQTASSKASEASQSATTASNKATESAQSASQALSYKTDAESAKTASQTAQGLAESARDSAISAKNDAEQAKADAITAKEEAESAVASISGALDDKADVITDTASGSIASFSDGADDLPLKSLVVNIDPVQDTSSGDPSPENICPISGWTGMTVNATGKNLLDEANATIYKRYFQNTSGGYVWASSPDSSSYVFKCLPNTIYTLKHNNPNVSIFRVATINVSIEESENATLNQVSVMTNPRTITTDSDATYIVIQQSNAIASAKETQLQIELGDSATEYEPFKGASIPISWQTEVGTVYGGKLDVLSGVLRIDMAMVDFGTLTWVYDTTTHPTWAFFRTIISERKAGWNNFINSIYPLTTSQYDRTGDKVITGASYYSGKNIIVRDTSYTDATAFKTAVTGQRLVYKLATPIEIQLTPQQVNSLLGVNNIWADTGDCSVGYRADTKMYINKKIAEAISALS